MAQYPRGFPAWFMTALPCPLPKHDDLPDGSSARPITILRQSQLYGTWAAVATSQIVKVLAGHPLGLLDFCLLGVPVIALIVLNLNLNFAAKVRNRCSGIVMDLKKCFNNIGWICGFISLKEIGVPIEILRAWIHSIANVCRYWVIQREYFPAGPLLEVFQWVTHGAWWLWWH